LNLSQIYQSCEDIRYLIRYMYKQVHQQYTNTHSSACTVQSLSEKWIKQIKVDGPQWSEGDPKFDENFANYFLKTLVLKCTRLELKTRMFKKIRKYLWPRRCDTLSWPSLDNWWNFSNTVWSPWHIFIFQILIMCVILPQPPPPKKMSFSVPTTTHPTTTTKKVIYFPLRKNIYLIIWHILDTEYILKLKV